MRSFTARWARLVGLAMALVASTTVVAATTPVRPSTDVTDRDIEASNAKVAMAYGALVTMWNAEYRRIGARFAPPAIVRYRGAVRTDCGVMPANNALYCPQLNTIFYDDVFLARQTKAAAEQLGTDGDMAAVGIIAHEMGHAAAMQLGQQSRVPYENEAIADCLAGAFALQSAKDGSLEKGDLEEAFFGLAAAGDPTPAYTGNRRIDSRIAMRAAYFGHGTREQRQSNFNSGYQGGPGACLEVFR